EQPIDFQAFDGQPVDTLFSLISPTVRAHLHLLSRLSFALRDTTFKETIRTQRSRDEIIREVERVERSFVPVDAAAAKNPENP
ncbi:MAG TPA: PTS sugar transporter subunit IIA, partial [Phycisphaerae bacterium]|nr:PTS sugar transporter subunit IIA [Phycisphaerae bacterium]